MWVKESRILPRVNFLLGIMNLYQVKYYATGKPEVLENT